MVGVQSDDIQEVIKALPGFGQGNGWVSIGWSFGDLYVLFILPLVCFLSFGVFLTFSFMLSRVNGWPINWINRHNFTIHVTFKKPVKLNPSICLTGMIWGKEFWMLGVSTDYDFNKCINVIQSYLILSICILEVFSSFHAIHENYLLIGPMIQIV